MITIEVNKKNYTFPECWDEVKFSQLIDIEIVNKDERESSIGRIMKILNILAEDPSLSDVLGDEDLDDVKNIFNLFSWINVEASFSDVIPKEFIEIEGEKFKIKKNHNSLTINEVIVVEEMVKAKVDYHHYELAFGIIFRKLDENGKELPLTLDLFYETINKFRNKVYLRDIYPVINFFLLGEQSGKKTFKSTSIKIKRKTQSNQKKLTKQTRSSKK
jgi:hypothetical protein